MIGTQAEMRHEAIITIPRLATDFDEWMAGWKWNWSGTRYTGRISQKQDDLPGNAWRAFKPEPRPAKAVECTVSLRRQFLLQNSRTTHKHSKSASPSAPSRLPPRPAPLFTADFYEVRESLKGGHGAFATKDLEVRTVIMAEEPLFSATLGEVFYEYEKLTSEQRTDFLSLHCWSDLGRSKILSIFKTNRFQISGPRCGIFIKSSRFNHACHPHASCTYWWNQELGRLVTTTINPIKKGEEITIQYTSNPSKLYEDYGFRCDCPSCPDPKVFDAQERMRSLGY